MFKKCIFILATTCMMYSCTTQTETNPFLSEFQTEHGVPPFDKIKLEHYEPAFLKGIEEQNANIDAIVNNSEAPTFENVIVALDNSAPILDRVSAIFYNMTDAEKTPGLNELSIKIAPTLSEHSDNISLNQELFKKVNAVYQQKESLKLTTEQERLLEETYKDFVRSGANLSPEKQARLREINKQLSTLGLTFSDNILNENNAFKLYIDKEEDLAGLPEWFRQSAAEEAKADGQEGKWLFTLGNASRLPFLQYSENRPLREQIYKAYINRGNNNDKNDNKKIITDIVSLRLEKAQLLGFDCYSNFVLDNTMAKNSATVMDFLNNLWSYSLPKAKAEAAAASAELIGDHEEEISFDDFCKVELRVAEVRACERMKESKKLLHLTVFDGERERCILSGIAKWFAPEDLIGKKIGIVANLAPRPMMKGKYVSEGMIFAADTDVDGGCSIAFFPDSTPAGARIH